MSANSDIGLMALTVSPRGIGRSGLQGLLESASRSAWSSHLLVLLHHRGRHWGDWSDCCWCLFVELLHGFTLPLRFLSLLGLLADLVSACLLQEIMAYMRAWCYWCNPLWLSIQLDFQSKTQVFEGWGLCSSCQTDSVFDHWSQDLVLVPQCGGIWRGWAVAGHGVLSAHPASVNFCWSRFGPWAAWIWADQEPLSLAFWYRVADWSLVSLRTRSSRKLHCRE